MMLKECTKDLLKNKQLRARAANRRDRPEIAILVPSLKNGQDILGKKVMIASAAGGTGRAENAECSPAVATPVRAAERIVAVGT